MIFELWYSKSHDTYTLFESKCSDRDKLEPNAKMLWRAKFSSVEEARAFKNKTLNRKYNKKSEVV